MNLFMFIIKRIIRTSFYAFLHILFIFTCITVWQRLWNVTWIGHMNRQFFESSRDIVPIWIVTCNRHVNRQVWIEHMNPSRESVHCESEHAESSRQGCNCVHAHWLFICLPISCVRSTTFSGLTSRSYLTQIKPMSIAMTVPRWQCHKIVSATCTS